MVCAPTGVAFTWGFQRREARDFQVAFENPCGQPDSYWGDRIERHLFYYCADSNYELFQPPYEPGPMIPACRLKTDVIDPAKEPRGCCNGENSTAVGNPINVATGRKYQRETDYASNALRFERFYWDGAWRTTYSRQVVPSNINGSHYDAVIVRRDDGQEFTFELDSGVYASAPDVNSKLEQIVSGGTPAGWRYTDLDHTVELYDVNGRLTSITTRAGLVDTLVYDVNDRLASVTDSFGKQLTLGYDGLGRLATLTNPENGIFAYGYSSNGDVETVTGPDLKVRTYIYNESAYTGGANLPHALMGIVDESNNRFATFKYDSLGRAVQSEHAGGAERTIVAYNVDGTSTITDPLGTARTMTIIVKNAVGKPATVTGPGCGSCGLSASYTYDANGNITERVDWKGVHESRSYSYDGRNLETSRWEANGTGVGRSVLTQWHSTYRLPTQIDESGKRTTLTHDASGNVLTKTILDTDTSESRTWTYTYSGVGQVLTANGPRTDASDVTTCTYYTCTTGYQCGQVATITNALGHVTTYNTYNAHGQPLTITDPNGVVTTLTYDLRQRLTSRTVAAEQIIFEYWPTGLLKKATLPDGSYLEYTYDAAHRLTTINDAQGNRIAYTLDAMGNRTKEDVFDSSLTLSRTRTQVFNALNQLSQQIGAAGTPNVTTAFGYDSNGNQTSIVAPLARNTTQVYDELNRLASIADPGAGLTEYGYDALDQLISVTDPRGLATTYSYNSLGDLQQQVSPDTGTTTNTYDSGGNLGTSTNAQGIITTYSYDALNRVNSTAFKLGTTTDQTITYNYDTGTNGKGHLTSASDANHSMAWTYDAQGHVTGKSQVVGSITQSVGYGYVNGQLTAITTPSGQTITYGYTNNQITSLQVNGASVLSSVVYEPFGPPKQWTWGNGTQSSRTYDQDAKVTQITGPITTTYSYDDAFRITGITDTTNSALSWLYGYDNLDRLTSASKTGTTIGYTYDANGNRLSQTGTSASTYTIAANSNRLTGTSGALSRTYGYNSDGNINSYTGISFQYNNRGRIKSSTTNNVTTNYTYNALGELVKKSTGMYVYDEAGHVLGQYTTSGGLTSEIVWLGNTPVATIRPASGGGVEVFYIHADHLNTPRVVTQPSNNAQRWRWDSNPFGSPPNDNPSGLGAFTLDLRFPGQISMPESGLYYNYMRDYDASTGRYVQSDPVGLRGGINTYVYVKNQPLRYFDPLGLDPWLGADVGSAAAIAIGGYGGGVGGLVNPKTGESCAVSIKCVKVGPSMLFSLIGIKAKGQIKGAAVRKGFGWNELRVCC